eukprot:2546916-Alexandrium_andersonii.AAC.1
MSRLAHRSARSLAAALSASASVLVDRVPAVGTRPAGTRRSQWAGHACEALPWPSEVITYRQEP